MKSTIIKKTSELKRYANRVKSDKRVRNILELPKLRPKFADCLQHDRSFKGRL